MREERISRIRILSPGGFTLVELVIALAIMGVVVVLVFGAMRIGVRAWEKGERDIESRQRERIALDLLKRQISSAYSPPESFGLEQIPAFAGDPRGMEFLSKIPLLPEHRYGLVTVRYRVAPVPGRREKRLLFSEGLPAVGQRETETPGREGDVFALIGGFTEIGFQYLKASTEQEAAGWEDVWDPEVDTGLPRAVKIVFMRGEDPLVLIARIPSGGESGILDLVLPKPRKE